MTLAINNGTIDSMPVLSIIAKYISIVCAHKITNEDIPAQSKNFGMLFIMGGEVYNH